MSGTMKPTITPLSRHTEITESPTPDLVLAVREWRNLRLSRDFVVSSVCQAEVQTIRVSPREGQSHFGSCDKQLYSFPGVSLPRGPSVLHRYERLVVLGPVNHYLQQRLNVVERCLLVVSRP